MRLFRLDGLEEPLERGLEMGLVVYDQGVLSEKASMDRSSSEADAVSAEEQAAPDHVDCAANDRRS
jgi:hypothetical protein